MIRFNGFDTSGLLRSVATLALAVSMVGVTLSDADAQRRRNNNQEDSEQNQAERVFSAAIGQIVLEAQEFQANDQFAESITALNRALGNDSINPYERMISLQMRGRAYYEQDQVSRAIQDWEAAINTGAMLPQEISDLRINIGQLYIAEGQYAQGIQSLEAAVAQLGVDALNPRVMRMLAQAYAQAERYRDGVVWAERFWNAQPAGERVRGDYSLMLFFYQQLERVPDQFRIIEEMVQRWPTEKNNWRSYASLLAQTGREQDAFEANKIMYINGMLTESREVVALAQYYSFYEYPYRGAVVLERELNAGTVERTRNNLNLLANMWRQSREWERATPVLRQLAQLSGDGDDYLKLAEALFQRRELDEAEAAFTEALNRGGLDRPGDAWTLLGNVRAELGREESAIAAFREGARYPYSRQTANGWVTFLTNRQRAARERVQIRERVRQDECRFLVGDLVETGTLLGDIDDTGRIVIEVPDRCSDLYNQYGEERSAVAEAEAAENGADAG
ncbi:tetratricopeptide repeat protein [uncultured Maricaulis sp.]|uniref:tetratricopeptide repeat protein n=1 Tax=uncultured Maricaulis sp. TaxID=174710 RepID=UPI00262B1E52|nr:tetratricopeptide repeat protein [uncultured Maricaulis sp.]